MITVTYVVVMAICGKCTCRAYADWSVLTLLAIVLCTDYYSLV